MPKRLLITPGEPSGIGPDVTVHIAQQKWPAELVVIADPDLLLQRARQINLPLKLLECDLTLSPKPQPAKTLSILPVKMSSPASAGILDSSHAQYVLQTLELAASLSLAKKAHALVTGPVHKEMINQSGLAFTGHTEFFAQYCKVPHTVMLFVVAQLKVALVTTHIPLSKVAESISPERLKLILTILHSELMKKFGLKKPRILVCGLNPHAGEGGYLGREEMDTIKPTINELIKQNYHIEGPLPADTIFTPKYLKKADVILAMYHDQALPLVKYAGFGHAVNVTLGLPFIRTSVDHGTAIDVAGTQEVDPGSMKAAVQLAIRLATEVS